MEFEKYDIEIPARIEFISANEARSFFLRTTSISAREVFFHTDEPLPDNTQVSLGSYSQFYKTREIGQNNSHKCYGNGCKIRSVWHDYYFE